MPYSTPTILMCPPDFYGIEYEINPWMSRSRGSDRDEATRQWTALKQAIESAGAIVMLQPPVDGLPDLVFTANAGMMFRDLVFLSRFRHEARQGETPVDAEWFTEHGYLCKELPEGMSFEGAGDALFCGDTLFGGYFIRSDALAMQAVGEAIDCRVIPLQLVNDRYYHLDTCFCPLREGLSIWYPPAFDEYAQRTLRELFSNGDSGSKTSGLIEVNDIEATRFACNAVVIGDTVILNTGCPELEATLQQHGFQTVATPLDEFLKAGGSAKCLTLRLDGEDAARWRW